jgi:hypothetical protein
MSDDTDPISNEKRVAQSVLNCLLALHCASPAVSVAVADAFLEQVAPAWPECAPLFSALQTEADWWADCAPDTAAASMLQACLKRIAIGQMPLAINARKRAMVAIWNTLGEKDRAAFLAYAEPGSAARA